MVRKCYLCAVELLTPGSQEIKDIYKRDRIILCMTCVWFYKRNPQYWLSYKDCEREKCERSPCDECFQWRPLLDGYCAPCWVRYHGGPPEDAPAAAAHQAPPPAEVPVASSVAVPRPAAAPSAPAAPPAAHEEPVPPARVSLPTLPEPEPQPPRRPARRSHTAIEAASPSEWECGTCTMINSSDAEWCAACDAPQPGHGRTQGHAVLHEAAAAPGSNEWACEVCTLVNPSGDLACGACGSPRPETAADVEAEVPAAETPSRSHSPSYTDEGESDAESEGSSIADGWECESCTLINRSDVVRCLVCDEPREDVELDDSDVVDAAASPTFANEALGWACDFCTYVNASDDTVCAVCNAASSAWQCTRCKGRNNGKAKHCVHCDLERSWECASCTFDNKPGTLVCAMCNESRAGQRQAGRAAASPSPELSDEKQDVWKCGKCTAVNDMDCLSCEICGAFKPRRTNKVLTIGSRSSVADKYDDVIRARVKKPAAKRVAPVPRAARAGGKGGKGGMRGAVSYNRGPPAAPVHYDMGGRHLMIINNLRRSDKVNNHALRVVFDKLGACNVAVIVKDGKKTGQGVVEFDTHEELQAALEKTRKMTICESKIKTHRCSADEFKNLPEAWKKGKMQAVQRPDHIPSGPRIISRIAVVRADRCKNDKCSRECSKMCPVGATNNYGVCRIDEAKCTGCTLCVKKKVHKGKQQGCPYNAIIIVNIPKELTDMLVNRYGRNGFSIARLPVLKPDRLLGLVGENGAGKSTVLKILAGKLVPNGGSAEGRVEATKWPDSVKAHYKGTELWGLIMRLEQGRARASFKVQHVDRLREETHMPVREFLNAGNVDQKRLQTLVDELSLGVLMDRTVDVLSGGEVQRVAVAAAVLKDAEIYLFDEPSSFLDVRQRLRVCEAIRDVMDGSRYVVCVEHDLAVCDYLADAVAVLHGKAGAFGVVSKPMNVRDGINAFLQGFLEHENVRFRNHALNFKMHEQDDTWVGGAGARHRYPTVGITRGTFSLSIKSGELRAGEVTAFLGENGCGKTTLLELMSGLLTPDNGEPLISATTYLKPQIITMPAGRTVKDVVDERIGRVEKHTQRHQVIMDEVMEPLMIEDLLVLEADKLSGGEMQRVALAIALCNDADVLLIDEPSAFLDAELRMTAAKAIRRVALLLKKIVVVVEHDLMMTSFMADRVVVFEGTPAVECTASSAEAVSSGLNRFLRQLDVSVRLDAVTHRPRFNKRGSVLDREQRAKGEYYADAAEIKDVYEGTLCPVCDFISPPKAKKCGRCGIRIDEDED